MFVAMAFAGTATADFPGAAVVLPDEGVAPGP
jgi:hypothetical protein